MAVRPKKGPTICCQDVVASRWCRQSCCVVITYVRWPCRGESYVQLRRARKMGVGGGWIVCFLSANKQAVSGRSATNSSMKLWEEE